MAASAAAEAGAHVLKPVAKSFWGSAVAIAEVVFYLGDGPVSAR